MKFVFEAWIDGHPRALRVDAVDAGVDYGDGLGETPKRLYRVAWSYKVPEHDLPIFGSCSAKVPDGSTFAHIVGTLCMFIDRQLGLRQHAPPPRAYDA